MKLLAALIFAALALTPSSVTAADTVYIIRHLEKAEGDDPSLTDEGAAGARKLAEILADKEIAVIFASETRRAMETAAPLAQRLRLRVTPYDPRDPDALVRAAAGAGGTVLVVGHSNTVGDLVARFGGTKAVALTEEDYGTVFIVAPDGTVTTAELR